MSGHLINMYAENSNWCAHWRNMRAAFNLLCGPQLPANDSNSGSSVILFDFIQFSVNHKRSDFYRPSR
jgi:hypothetical protein